MTVLNLVLAFVLSFTLPDASKLSTIDQPTCDGTPYRDKCLKKLPQGYTFLKSYTIDGKNGTRKKKKVSYIFSKGSVYFVTLANAHPKNEGIKVTLYDSNRKRLASSYAKGKYYEAMAYRCPATGLYFLEFEFENTRNYCAGSVLAFKR